MHSPLPFISLFSPFTILPTMGGFSLIELYSISYLLKSVLAVSSAIEAGVRKAKKIEEKGAGPGRWLHKMCFSISRKC